MRRFVILAAIIAACFSGAEIPAHGQVPPGRLGRYNQADAVPQPTRRATARPRRQPSQRAGATPVGYEQSRRSRQRVARASHYQQTEPTYYQEDLPPGAVVEGPMSDQWTGGPPWEYEGGFYDDGYCGDCCDDCCGWGPMPGFWGRAEYLYWWLRGSETPPLVTTSPDGTPQAQAGVLPEATVLFGGERLNQSGRSGARFTLGYWFNCCDYTGIDTSVFFLGKVNQQYYNDSQGSPILARPFFNVINEAQDAQLIAYPDIVVGSIAASSTSHVYGGDVNLRRALFVDCWTSFQVLAGYRYFGLVEGLGVESNTESIDPNGSVPVGTTFAIFDRFDTNNYFHGGQLGVATQFINGCWTVDLGAKLALGAVSQRVKINGGTTTTVPGQEPVNAAGGILALGSNSGTYHRKQFAVLPEFLVDVRYQLTPLWRLNLGYTLMILTNVVRPGDQIDLNIDPNQFPPSSGGTQPRFAFHNSDIWLQGLNVGIECNF